jgi:ribonuclease HI
MAKKRIYVVVEGKIPGFYTSWAGPNGAQEQVSGVAGAKFKGFGKIEEAKAWLKEIGRTDILERINAKPATPSSANVKAEDEIFIDKNSRISNVIMYSDGSSINNPGPGGYGIVLKAGKKRKELGGGFRKTTNNRMELMGCIVGLETLKKKCTVTLYSDSQYVVKGITEGWAEKWQRQGWQTSTKQPAENADLWSRLLDLCDRHEVTLKWVKGHAGNPENERCDEIANEWSQRDDLPPDENFESRKTQIRTKTLFDDL